MCMCVEGVREAQSKGEGVAAAAVGLGAWLPLPLPLPLVLNWLLCLASLVGGTGFPSSPQGAWFEDDTRTKWALQHSQPRPGTHTLSDTRDALANLGYINLCGVTFYIFLRVHVLRVYVRSSRDVDGGGGGRGERRGGGSGE